MEDREEEALGRCCRVMVSRVRHKQQQQQQLQNSEVSRNNKEAGGRRQRSEGGDDRVCNLPERQPSLGLKCQGPQVQTVPLQLISTLRLKTLKEEMRRAADMELHEPSLCSMCEQQQASLALRSFIWRKKTQLQLQTLTGRLNTPSSHRDDTNWMGLCSISQSRPIPLTGFGRDYLLKICGSPQPGVAIATTEERGVALATDEMRGHPDKSATGTHLARPRCPFPDR
ncbi:hypothetical protein JOB18_014511 [Solea senegalensis]|nr:uncharacterized protein LOC122778354 isoform X1 [Solea senegalensis]XP_043896069.1 uncharacterized protein LOC122778354 isoform X1 [Solea senegalensis]KAG7517704.1 hypothetical protein JOB18_014511 [Solea senegalensis]KAG7517705.1 hypothetical protein JOB18_014511 [Solea senegalensis]